MQYRERQKIIMETNFRKHIKRVRDTGTFEKAH